ncbi:succinate--hydroxymethylglutarate CoA-transferase [Saccopteryx leptura]|uniref:succinate--hydroxymethylglutarate CoA-transferase n=1 Tax=Saccopteryx leptura TaxID=249018 RepID=UPI00339C484B
MVICSLAVFGRDGRTRHQPREGRRTKEPLPAPPLPAGRGLRRPAGAGSEAAVGAPGGGWPRAAVLSLGPRGSRCWRRWREPRLRGEPALSAAGGAGGGGEAAVDQPPAISYELALEKGEGKKYSGTFLTGYGQTDPLSQRAGYDTVASALSGMMHITEPDVENHMISSDSISSSTSTFWSSSSTLCDKQNAHMLNKGVQAGNLEIVNGVKKHTRDVGVTFPTPISSKTRVEEDSDVTSWSEEKIAEKIEEKKLLTNYLGDKKLRKNKQSSCEGVSWFVPVENVKSGPKKEKLLKPHGPGISWFAPVTNTKPWREPLRNRTGRVSTQTAVGYQQAWAEVHRSHL